MSAWVYYISGGVAILGALLTVVGAYGVLRLPDMYTRLHAASVTDTLATFLVLFGCAIWVLAGGDWLIAVKLGIILIFLWITSPLASYALAHAAFFDGQKPKLDHDLTEDKEGSA